MKKSDLVPQSKKQQQLRIVLCLYGEANVGKSEILSAVGYSMRKRARYYYEQKGTSKSRDRRIAVKFGSRVIGIGTYGDDKDSIDRNFQFFQEQKCDIGITAARKEKGRNLLRYVRQKCGHIPLARRKKYDALTEYTRAIAKCVYVDLFATALKKKAAKDIKNIFEK